MSVSCFSQTISTNVKVFKDKQGITYFAFDSIQTTEIIKSLKEINWDKKQIEALEQQLKNVKFENKTQSEKIQLLEDKIQTYIKIELNLNEQIKVSQEKIDYLNKDLEKYKKNTLKLKVINIILIVAITVFILKGG